MTNPLQKLSPDCHQDVWLIQRFRPMSNDQPWTISVRSVHTPRNLTTAKPLPLTLVAYPSCIAPSGLQAFTKYIEIIILGKRKTNEKCSFKLDPSLLILYEVQS